jgi:hypothetical protein
MSFKAELKAALGWNWIEGAVDNGRVDFAKSFSGGSGAGQADAVWSQSDQPLTGGTATTVDLTNLPRILLGANHRIVFERIMAILLVNQTTDGGTLLVGGAENDEWAEPFAAAGQQIVIPLDSPLLLANRQEGWPVDPTHRNLKIATTGGDATYSLAILGVLNAELSYG